MSTPVEYRELDSSCFINISTALNLLMRVYPTHRLFFLSLSLSSLSLSLSHSAFATNVGQNLSPPRIICSIVTTTLFSSSWMKKREEERERESTEGERESTEREREREWKNFTQVPMKNHQPPISGLIDRTELACITQFIGSNSFPSRTLFLFSLSFSLFLPFSLFLSFSLSNIFYPKFCEKNVSPKNETFRLLFI